MGGQCVCVRVHVLVSSCLIIARLLVANCETLALARVTDAAPSIYVVPVTYARLLHAVSPGMVHYS